MSSKIGWRTIRGMSTVALLATVLPLGGCMVKSTTPVVDAKNRVFDARLVGTWQSDDGKQTAVVTAQDSGYLVLYTDERGKTGRFDASLGRLGRERVLDLVPDDEGLESSDSYKGMLLPLHTFLLIDSIGTEITARSILADSVKAYLERDPAAIAHVKAEDDVILTAATDELRAFFETFAARPGVLDGPQVWKRR